MHHIWRFWLLEHWSVSFLADRYTNGFPKHVFLQHRSYNCRKSKDSVHEPKTLLGVQLSECVKWQLRPRLRIAFHLRVLDLWLLCLHHHLVLPSWLLQHQSLSAPSGLLAGNVLSAQVHSNLIWNSIHLPAIRHWPLRFLLFNTLPGIRKRLSKVLGEPWIQSHQK